MYYSNLKRGKDYKDCMKTIVIAIMDFEYFKEGDFHEIATVKRNTGNLPLTDKMELHYIQLPKFRKKCKKLSSGIDYWLALIMNYEMEEVRKMAKEKKTLQKAIDETEYLTGEEAEKRWAYLRLKAEIDENTAYSNGLEQGVEKEKIAIAKKMLEQKVDIELIKTCTGLTEEEISNLKEE